MINLSYFHAIILGLVQGLTEFLPVSSSAHLVFAQKALGLEPSANLMILFDMLMHMGTLIAMAVVFGPALLRYLRRLAAESTGSWSHDRLAWKFLWLGVIASIPTAIIGVVFKKQLEESFGDIRAVGWQLVITGVLLIIVAWLPRGRRGWRKFNALHAFLIGTAQGIAIIPGISRSGATISTAAYCGLRRRWAADFSFFIAAPAILGATALKLKDAFKLPKEELASLPWWPMFVGSVVSMIVGAFTLWLLLRIVRRAKLHWFAIYCWIVGLLAATGYMETLFK